MEWAELNAPWRLRVINRPKGRALLSIRWTVGRTFAYLGKCRRLGRDCERSVRSSEAFVELAMINLMLNRLEPKRTDAEFRYRNAAS